MDKPPLPVPPEVYHASPDTGLKRLEPRESTHRRPWVYAALDLALAATQLSGKGGDFICGTGRVGDGPIFICERFPGAFDHRYGDRSGSIYVLPGSTFERGRTTFSEEVVSESPVDVLRDIEVPNVEEYLLMLAREDRLIIYDYPDRPHGIPNDDQDLVDRGIMWARRPASSLMEYVREHHPHLEARILAGMEQAGSSGDGGDRLESRSS